MIKTLFSLAAMARDRVHTHEKIVGVWYISTYTEELHQVVELAVYITAYLYQDQRLRFERANVLIL